MEQTTATQRVEVSTLFKGGPADSILRVFNNINQQNFSKPASQALSANASAGGVAVRGKRRKQCFLGPGNDIRVLSAPMQFGLNYSGQWG